MRTIGGILLGILLFFPGVEFLRWLTLTVGAYDSMTLTDGCLLMIIILLCVHLVRGRPGQAAERKRRPTRESDDFEETPQLHYLPSERPRTSRRAAPRTRRTSSKRPGER